MGKENILESFEPGPVGKTVENSVKETTRAAMKVVGWPARRVVEKATRTGNKKGEEEGILWSLLAGRAGTRRFRFVHRLKAGFAT